jgi:hypothetical protein
MTPRTTVIVLMVLVVVSRACWACPFLLCMAGGGRTVGGMEMRFAVKSGVLQKQAIEGPTRAQARRMAARRLELLAKAAAAMAADDHARALELDCSAWDVERDLRTYGYEWLLEG